MVKIELTLTEILFAATVGMARQIENIKKNRKPRYGADSFNDWQKHINGCLAEMCVAKHFGVYWSGNIGDLWKADVEDLQVRSTPWDNGKLCIHKAHEDKDDDVFILVTGVNGTHTIRGWLTGHEGRKRGEWHDRYQKGRPAFWVDQRDLYQINSLKLI